MAIDREKTQALLDQIDAEGGIGAAFDYFGEWSGVKPDYDPGLPALASAWDRAYYAMQALEEMLNDLEDYLSTGDPE